MEKMKEIESDNAIERKRAKYRVNNALRTINRQKQIDAAILHADIAQMKRERYPHKEIREKLGISNPTLCRHLKALEEELLASGIMNMDALRRKELEELDEMEDYAAQALRETGEVQWFRERLKTKEQKAKLIGLNAPVRTDITSDGNALPVVNITMPHNGRDLPPAVFTVLEPEEGQPVALIPSLPSGAFQEPSSGTDDEDEEE